MSSPLLVPQFGRRFLSEAHDGSRPASSQHSQEHSRTCYLNKHYLQANSTHRSTCDFFAPERLSCNQQIMAQSNDVSRSVLVTNTDQYNTLTELSTVPDPTDYRSMYGIHQYFPVNQQTLEPRMMFYDQSPTYNNNMAVAGYGPASYLQTTEAPHNPYASFYAPVTPQEQYFSDHLSFSPVSSEASMGSTGSSVAEDEETDRLEDQPYAKLIYRALRQAPDHRMMLRDIYEWFTKNTNKPRESGTNGWQNSIRHNLSMNQAFENDKSDASSRGQPRKANSVWVLTKSAIENGVQSTTRYRKSTSFKKGLSQRGPTAERQKSGFKGGRATRQTANHRRQELSLRNKTLLSSTATDETPFAGWVDSSASPPDQIFTPRYCPTSPTDDQCHTPAPDWAHSPLNIDTSTCMPHEYDQQIGGQPLHQLGDPMFEQLHTYLHDNKGPLSSMFA